MTFVEVTGRNKFSALLHEYLAGDGESTRKSMNFDLVVVALILISSAIFVAETYTLPAHIAEVLRFVDVTIILLFTIEYFARIHVSHPSGKYIFSWLGFVDFIAFAPFWFSFFFPWIQTLQFLRVFRVFKLFRFFRQHLQGNKRYIKDMQRVLIAKMLFVVFTLIFVSASLIFILESPHNPGINTFDDAVYFVVVTVTTVGFGDITPVTRGGRMAISVMIMLGILLIPVYMASLMRTYMMYYKREHRDKF